MSAVPAARSDRGALHWECITEGFSSLPLCFIFLGGEGRVASLCARGGVEGYNLEHRGSFVSPSYDLEVKTSALGGPLSELSMIHS